MAERTTYIVGTEYVVNDRSSSVLGRIGSQATETARRSDQLRQSFDQVTRSSGGLGRMLGTVGAGLAGYLGIRQAKESLIDFNSQLDSMRIGLSTVISSQMHVPFEQAKVSADALFGTLQQMAKASPATTKDFTEMASAIAGSVAAAGLSVRDLADITQGAIIASQALAGGRSDVVATDIQQMLSGQVGVRDRVASQLLGGIGMSREAFNEIDDVAKRAEIVRKALNTPTLKRAADEFGKSFQGQLSTLKDNLEITLGRVGQPLFAAITKELQKWNGWLDANQDKVNAWADKFAKGLVQAFEVAKSVMGWIVEHKDVLLKIAEAALLLKGARLVGDTVQGAAGAVGRLASGRGGVIGTAAELGSLAFLGGYVVGDKLGTAYREAGADYDRSANQQQMLDLLIRQQQSGYDFGSVRTGSISGLVRDDGADLERLREIAIARGFAEAGAGTDSTVIVRQAEEQAQEWADALKRQLAVENITRGLETAAIESQAALERQWLAGLHPMARSIVMQTQAEMVRQWYANLDGPVKAMMQSFATAGTTIFEAVNPFGPKKDDPLGLKGQAKGNKTTININKVEVPAKDPDRWVRDLNNAVAKQARAPRAARGALAGGGL